MKHYVTVLRTQKITYCIESDDMHNAFENAMHIAACESQMPCDAYDAEFEVVGWNSEFFYNKKGK